METTKTIALKALRLLFRPIARILLKAGVSWKEFLDVCKATYVEVASEDFGIRGRPTNVSRVALMTGFSRREVRRLRDLLAAEQPVAFDHMNYATRVLTGWHSDEDFLDQKGAPRPLQPTGSNPSFETLCSRYSGDVPASTLLKELRHVGAVAVEADGRLVAKSRYYMPVLTDPEQVLRSGSVLEDIGNTVAYNLHREPDQPSRFEGRATTVHLPESAIADFRDFIEREGQAFLGIVDDWLTEHEDRDSGEGIRLGMGAYWIEEHKSNRVVT